MKTLVIRAGLLVTLLSLVAPLRAKDAQDASPDPASEPAAAPAPSTDDETLRSLAETQVAPADPARSEDPATLPVETAASTPMLEAAAPEAPVVESLPLPPPPEVAPAVGVSAAGSFTAAEESPRARRSSDWIFVGIVALAAAGILRRFAREPLESVSIHDATESSARPPIVEAGPPILRKR